MALRGCREISSMRRTHAELRRTGMWLTGWEHLGLCAPRLGGWGALSGCPSSSETPLGVWAKHTHEIARMDAFIVCVHNVHFSPLLKSAFNWRIIASQYCAGFCHATGWISHKHIHILSVLSLLPPQSQPSRSSQGTELSSLCYIWQLPASWLFYTW